MGLIKKRRTQIKELVHFDELQKSIGDNNKSKRHLDSFKEKLDFAKYFVEKYEESKEYYGTNSQQHDIALIFKANAEAAIFICKSSLDCLANALNEICNLTIPKVYFNRMLVETLRKNNYTEIAQIINNFIAENDYFFKLRNSITHNVVLSAQHDLELSSKKIEMRFQELAGCNIPDNLEVGNYSCNLMDKIYKLAEDIFKHLLDEEEKRKRL